MLKKSIMTFLCGGTLSLMAIAGASAQSQTYVLDKGWEFHRLAAMNGCLHVCRALFIRICWIMAVCLIRFME